MPLGVEFQLGGESIRALRAINAVQTGMNKLTDTAKGEIATRLKQIFTVAAIEEATRRTGEWALELEKTSKAMGTTAEKMEAMQLLARKANVDEGKVTGFFDELDVKRREAIDGNTELIQSFQAMGVSLKDLMTMSKSDLFGKLLSNQNIQSVVAGSPQGRALENLIGQGNIPTFQAIGQEANGKNLSQYSDDAAASGQTVGNQSVADMAAMWNEIKQDMTQALVQLSPVGKLLLGLVEMLSKAILGIVTLVSNQFNLLKGLLTGDLDLVKSSGLSTARIIPNIIFGIVKMFTGITDMIAKGLNSWLSKIPGLGKLMGDSKDVGITKYVQQLQDSFNEKTDASRKEIRGGEGIGDVATIIASGGTGGAARSVSGGLMNAAGVAERFGATGIADRLLTNAVKVERLGGILPEGGLAGQGVKQIMKGRMGKVANEYAATYAEEQMGKLIKTPEGMGLEQDAAKFSQVRRNYFEEGKAKWAKEELPDYARNARMMAGYAGTVGTAGMAGAYAMNNRGNRVAPAGDQPFNGAFLNQAPTQFTGDSNGMLKFGGVFGTGLQARIIRLNEQMVSLLAEISRNTAYNPYSNTPLPQHVNPNGLNTGGI